MDSVTGPERTWPWWEATRDLVGDVGGFFREWGSLLVWAAVGGWLIAAAVEGRDRSPGAGWLVRPDRDEGSWVDERMISRALAHLGIAPLNRFFTDGGDLIYPVPARRDGDGTSAQVRLPLGVTADMVAARRSKLAANLGRSSLETWPTKGEEDGILDLWIADKGVLKSGAGRWPLLDEGQEVDVFDGVPFGLSQRGQVLTAPLVGMTWLIGGRPGQGKSSALRTLMLGAALDPTTDMWAFILGESPDFAPFAPRLARYQMGLDDAVAESTTTALEDLLVEMERRGKVLGQQPGSPPKVSRKLADRRALGLHPILCGIDECHELFQHPRFGRRAAELAVRLIKRGRKYGISLLLATQSPTKDSIPREVTRNITCGVAFSVADQVANDGLLGAGKYAAGIRATDLRITADRGTCVAVGITDEPFELVRTFYIPLEDGEDEVTPVIQRSLALIEEQGRAIARDTDRSESPGPSPDILDDITEIMDGQTRLRTQIVLTRLAELNPEAYEGWTGRDLRTALDSYGIRPAKSGGNMVVRSRDVSTALASRGREEEGEPPGSEGGSPGRSPSQVPPADQGEPQSGRPGTARTAHEQCRPASGSPPPGGRSLPHGPDSA
ncbi:hypothetical protein [Actinoalloteichus caeruleus]|uniref:hypothetical protein n=1 Tax=Actinoalloteichus cyanogriseus TaxID=2893586 RepID=UPI003AAF5DFF